MGEYSFLLAIGGVFMLGTMSPGPSFILVAKTAVAKSRMEGVGVSIGLALGAVFFVLMAIFGLYAILETVPFLYGFLKLLGATYLLFLAYKMWKHADASLRVEIAVEEKPKSFMKAVLFGLMTQLSNPKTAIIIGSIFAALLPKVVPPYSEALLCLIAFLADVLWYCFVVVMLSTKRAQRMYLRFKKTIDRVAGSALGVLGIKLALDKA